MREALILLDAARASICIMWRLPSRRSLTFETLPNECMAGMAPPSSSSSSSSPRNQRSAHLRKQPPAPSQTPPKLLNRNAVPLHQIRSEFGSTPKNPWPYFPPKWRACRSKSVGDRFISLRPMTRGQAKDPSSITFTNCRMWVISTISTQYVSTTSHRLPVCAYIFNSAHVWPYVRAHRFYSSRYVCQKKSKDVVTYDA